MGFKDASGRVEIVTSIDAFECNRLQPRTEAETAREMREGPLYRIIASSSMQDKVEAKIASLQKLHNSRCRVEVITSKRELEALYNGEFRVKIDGGWVDDYGDGQ